MVDKQNTELKLYMSAMSLSTSKVSHVFHYTSSDNLMNILTKDDKGNAVISLRFTDIHCLNDYLENTDALRRFRYVCDLLLHTKKINESYYQIISTASPSETLNVVETDVTDADGKIRTSVHVARALCDRYVCCFSKGHDLLSMWNYYSKSTRYEGYSIGIKAYALDRYHIHQQSDERHERVTPFLVDMIYDDEQKDEIIKEAVMQLYNMWKADNNRSEDVIEILSHSLWRWGLVFKNNAYQHEQEVRLIFDIPKTDRMTYGVKYRTGHGLLIPYITIDYPSSVLQSITVGPFSNIPEDSTMQEEIIGHYLSEQGFKYVPNHMIKFSTVPARF